MSIADTPVGGTTAKSSYSSDRAGHVEVGQHSSAPSVNVAGVERAISIAIGSIIVARGLNRLSIPALLAIGVGSAIMNRGISGHCAAYQKLGVNTAE